MGKKSVIALIAVTLILVSFLIEAKTVGVAKANPMTFPTTPPTLGANWVYLLTITGNLSQAVDVPMPNLAHWRFSGSYTAGDGDSSIKIAYGSAYYLDKPFGIRSATFAIGDFEIKGDEQGGGSVQLKIDVNNILAYNIVVEYDSNLTDTTSTPINSTSPSSAPSPSPSPSPIPSLTISILSPVNDSFFNVSLEGVNYQLTYETNSTLSWVGYSIDGSNNATVTGNSTFVHWFVSSSGYHTLTVYANDTSGNWAIPQSVTYLVNVYHPTFPPDYTPTPLLSPTQQPTTVPFTLSTLIIVGLVVAIVVVAMLVYFRRTRKQK